MAHHRAGLFGSVLRDDFRPDSDVDVLVRFEPDHGWSLFDLVTLREELRELFGRDVEVLTRNSVERSRNPYRRQEILETAEMIYAR